MKNLCLLVKIIMMFVVQEATKPIRIFESIEKLEIATRWDFQTIYNNFLLSFATNWLTTRLPHDFITIWKKNSQLDIDSNIRIV